MTRIHQGLKAEIALVKAGKMGYFVSGHKDVFFVRHLRS